MSILGEMLFLEGKGTSRSSRTAEPHRSVVNNKTDKPETDNLPLSRSMGYFTDIFDSTLRIQPSYCDSFRYRNSSGRFYRSKPADSNLGDNKPRHSRIDPQSGSSSFIHQRDSFNSTDSIEKFVRRIDENRYIDSCKSNTTTILRYQSLLGAKQNNPVLDLSSNENLEVSAGENKQEVLSKSDTSTNSNDSKQNIDWSCDFGEFINCFTMLIRIIASSTLDDLYSSEELNSLIQTPGTLNTYYR